MNFLKRAVASIFRIPGKSMLLLLIIFILGNFISFSISMRRAVDVTDQNLRNKIGAIATAEWDSDKAEELEKKSGQPIEKAPLELDTVKAIGALPNVRYFDYSIQLALCSANLKQYSSFESDPSEAPEVKYTTFYCKGVQNPNLDDIKENKLKLLSGRTFNEDEMQGLHYVALVSQKLADLNGLKIGSKIKLNNIIFNSGTSESIPSDALEEEDGQIYASQTYEFEIIGLFEPTEYSEQTHYDVSTVISDPQNKIYTTITVMQEAARYHQEQIAKQYGASPGNMGDVTYQNFFVLNDPLKIDNFRKQAEQLLPELYKVTDNTQMYNIITAPMQSIGWIATIVLVVTTIASLAILSLLITLFLRDRRHEIGIYLALGEKKKKVISQVVLEVGSIACIAIILSLFTGNVLSGQISKSLLRAEITVQQQENTSKDGSFEENTVIANAGNEYALTASDILETYNVSLDWSSALLFFLVGFGVVVLSTLIPIVYVTRLNPKKILM